MAGGVTTDFWVIRESGGRYFVSQNCMGLRFARIQRALIIRSETQAIAQARKIKGTGYRGDLYICPLNVEVVGQTLVTLTPAQARKAALKQPPTMYWGREA